MLGEFGLRCNRGRLNSSPAHFKANNFFANFRHWWRNVSCFFFLFSGWRSAGCQMLVQSLSESPYQPPSSVTYLQHVSNETNSTQCPSLCSGTKSITPLRVFFVLPVLTNRWLNWYLHIVELCGTTQALSQCLLGIIVLSSACYNSLSIMTFYRYRLNRSNVTSQRCKEDLHWDSQGLTFTKWCNAAQWRLINPNTSPQDLRPWNVWITVWIELKWTGGLY